MRCAQTQHLDKMLLLLTLFSTSQPLLALHHSNVTEEKSASSNSFELDTDEEQELERLGLGLSRAHARVWREQFERRGKGRRSRRDVEGGHGIQENKEDTTKKKKDGRKRRAYWGLDKIFGQATKTKDHFSKELAGLPGLINRVGDLFGAGDDYDEDEVRLLLNQ